MSYNSYQSTPNARIPSTPYPTMDYPHPFPLDGKASIYFSQKYSEKYFPENLDPLGTRPLDHAALESFWAAEK